MLLSSFALGFNDVIPALLLLMAVLALQRSDLYISAALLATAISAKLSMVVALPFFCVYLANNKALRTNIKNFIVAFILSSLVWGIPFLFSPGGLDMISSNPEITKIYNLRLDLGAGISLLLVPLFIFLTIYLTWRIRRLNFELFVAMLGIAFLIIVLMTPASPGWFIWSLPFFSVLSGKKRIYRNFTSFHIFLSLYVGDFIKRSYKPPKWLSLIFNRIPSENYRLTRSEILSLLTTLMAAVGAVLAIRMYREGIQNNYYFRNSRKPFTIGIAGGFWCG